MILITQFWNFQDPKRKEEIYSCLLKNAMNRYITKIYVFSENDTYIKFTHNKIVPLKAKERLTYFDMFKVVSQSFNNQICIIANADIYFDESILKLNHIDFKNKIVALSSYDDNDKTIEQNAIDSWILKSITIPYNDYKIGTDYNDLKLLKSLKDYGIDLINPAKEIFSYHIDSTKKLKTNEYILDNYYIEPSTLDSMVKTHNTIDIKEVEKKNNIKTNDIPKEPIINPSPNPKQKIGTIIEEDLNTKNKRKVFIVKENTLRETKNTISTIVNTTASKIIRPNVKVCVHLHLYYHDLWDEFSSLLKNMNKYKCDIYITLGKNSATIAQTEWIKNKIRDEYKNVTIIETENKGLDIGPFLKVLEYIIERGQVYDYILKLHTKKSIKNAGIEFGQNWRKQLYQPLIGTADIVDKIIERLYLNETIGMVGNIKWISDQIGHNSIKIGEIKNILNIKTNDKKFIGGTMFWIKYHIINKYFNSKNIRHINSLLEDGYFTDYEKGTYTHAMERILGYIVSDSGKIISGT